MKKSSITIIILLLSLSLAGIIVLQGVWINNAWQTKQEDFDRGVKEALSSVAVKVEKREAASFISHRYPLPAGSRIFYQQSESFRVSNPASADSAMIADKNTGNHHDPDRKNYDTGKKVISIFTLSDSDEIHYSMDNMGQVMVEAKETDSTGNGSFEKRVQIKANQLNEVMYQMVMEWSNVKVPIDKRLPSEDLYQLIKGEFAKKGIDLPFQFAVVPVNRDSLCNVKSPSFTSSMVPVSFRADLFPNDIFMSPYQLLIHFNDMRPYFIKSLWLMLLLSAIFSVLIITTFASAIYIILKQKKVSEIKTDFINNMTHELKTPISTISVAIDAITNSKVLNDKDRIRYYSDIISRENKRMHSHVENILQMALVDKENLELNEQLLDVHDIIQRVADTVLMQVESRNGKLHLELSAHNAFIVADEIHLTNVIYNLLDNANKYSPHNPEITVTTRNEKSGLVIGVEDKGLGMSAETSGKIFEKFYREQNGNIHNIKGFGLGLAYVKIIVRKHGGTIKVKSELGKGSRFEVYLPLGHHQDRSNGVMADSKV